MFAECFWMLQHFVRESGYKLFYLWKRIGAWIRYWKSYYKYKNLAPPSTKPRLDYLYPCLGDDTDETEIEAVYFYQDSWVFEKIVNQQPKSHIDVGSHHKFVALLSKVFPVTIVDIRPLSLPLDSLKFLEGSILDLPFEDGSVSSLSSLCVVEHIGLGRYGDPLDPYGTEKAIEELKRVIAPGGHLWISVPVSDQNAVHFNAGRILSIHYLYSLIEPLQIIDQAFIVGRTLQKKYESRPRFGTTALLHLKKPYN